MSPPCFEDGFNCVVESLASFIVPNMKKQSSMCRFSCNSSAFLGFVIE